MIDAWSAWSPIFDGLLWERRLRARNGFELRSAAIELRGGGVAVFSPSSGLDPQDLASHAGEVRYLLAPNHFHYLGIRRWRDACPGAQAVASSQARKRLVKKLDVPWADLEELRAHLPEGARLVIPDGTRSGEVWWEIQRGDERVLVVCDAFFNLETLPGGMVGFVCKVTDTGPDLALGKTFKYLALGDRQAYKAFTLRYLEDHPPTVLVPMHGEVARGADLAKRLAELVRTRL